MVAANALTIASKTLVGNDPSVGGPVLVALRNASAATGDYTVRAITAATSIVVPSAATPGASNSTAFRMWIVGFDDGGTFRLGVVNALSGTSIMPLRDDIISSSTLTPANAAQVIYTTGAAVGARRCGSSATPNSPPASPRPAPGASSPPKLQLFWPGVAKPGDVVQVVRTEFVAVATGGTALPHDNTIPQITEGAQFMTQAITPVVAPNLLRPSLLATLTSAGGILIAGNALFRDSTANAIAACDHATTSANPGQCKMDKLVLAGSTAATTFKYRAGNSAGDTMTFNGTGGTQLYGGVENSFIEVSEIMA